MSDEDIAEILKLPLEVRLHLAEVIWANLVAEAATMPLGDAHRRVLDERLAEHEKSPDDVVPRDQVLADARQ
ncbi:MAG TPA: addiction module protein, partial [Burkholderiales bacterium]|nr:addiction module protein [Burkholderiales bacterium]